MCKRELTESLAELTEFAPKLSEFSLPKQYSRNSIPPVSYKSTVMRRVLCKAQLGEHFLCILMHPESPEMRAEVVVVALLIHELVLSPPRITTSLAPYRGHSGPSGLKSQKGRKKVPGASRARGQKRLKKSQKRVKNEWKTTSFRLFLTPGPRGPGNFFWALLGFRARRARMTPVRGQGGCNPRTGVCSLVM